MLKALKKDIQWLGFPMGQRMLCVRLFSTIVRMGVTN